MSNIFKCIISIFQDNVLCEFRRLVLIVRNNKQAGQFPKGQIFTKDYPRQRK